MLRISNRSWHYRLWRFGRESHTEPKDLCRYFWHILIVKLLIPGVIFALAISGVALLALLVWNNLAASAMIVAAIVLGAATLAGIFYLCYRLDKRHTAKKASRELEPPREPGVVRSYLVARKRKVCPLIHVEEAE